MGRTTWRTVRRLPALACLVGMACAGGGRTAVSPPAAATTPAATRPPLAGYDPILAADRLEITLHELEPGKPAVSTPTVDARGQVAVPFIGPFQVFGLSEDDA